MDNKCCGTCKWNVCEKKGNGTKLKIRFYCGNQDSTEYACPTAYSDSCEDWEEKEN